jgi:hypothetical protein
MKLPIVLRLCHRLLLRPPHIDSCVKTKLSAWITYNENFVRNIYLHKKSALPFAAGLLLFDDDDEEEEEEEEEFVILEVPLVQLYPKKLPTNCVSCESKIL